jgi:hypothetical protein
MEITIKEEKILNQPMIYHFRYFFAQQQYPYKNAGVLSGNKPF